MEIVETLYYYDGPQLATFRDTDGSIYLGVAVMERKGYLQPFFMVPISPERLDAVERDRMTLYAAFETAPASFLYDLNDEKSKLKPFTPKPRDFPGDLTLGS